MGAQHTGKMARLHFTANRAIDQMMLRGQPRQYRGHQVGIGPIGNFRIRSELRFGERPDTRLREQLETEPLRAEARHLFKPAPRMTRNRDQRHVRYRIVYLPA